MKIAIDLRGVRRTVELQRNGAGWTAAVEGRLWSVEVAPAGSRWAVRVSDPAAVAPDHLVPARVHDVAFEPATGVGASGEAAEGGFIVHVDGRPLPVGVVGRSRRAARAGGAGGGAASTGRRTILAPMPGRIVRVLVSNGDRVAARQPLVVVEAMKMENELRAPAAGTVVEVRATEGMSVDPGAVLVVIEPSE